MSNISAIELLSPTILRLNELTEDALSLRARATFSKKEEMFLDLVVCLSKAYAKKIEQQLDRFRSKNITDLNVIEPAVTEAKTRIDEISEYLKLVQKSHPIVLPLSTEGLVREITQDMTKEGVEFFINISSQLDYSTQPKIIENLASTIKAHGATLPESYSSDKIIAAIHFYATQISDILRHSVFAHEVGHVLINFDELYMRAYFQVCNNFNPILNQTLRDLSKNLLGGSPLRTADKQIVVQMYKRWMEEFFVDLVSIYSLGPAAIFAMLELTQEEVSLTFSASLTHPAIYKRIYLMWVTLDKLGFLNHLDSDSKNPAQQYVHYCSDFLRHDSKVTSNGIQTLNGFIDAKFLDDFADLFLSFGLNGKYDLENYTNEVPALSDFFANGVAACEIADLSAKTFKPVKGPSILNAAWVVEAKKCLDVVDLNNILDKALSNHYLKKQWMENC